jgi:hypothetical protein
MAIAAPLFYQVVSSWVTLGLSLVALVVEILAFINCLTQRADAFPVVGRIPKGGWLAINGLSILVTLLFGAAGSILGMIAVAAALVYLLDVRPALRDAVDGHGSW